jgi:hypothetical protein
MTRDELVACARRAVASADRRPLELSYEERRSIAGAVLALLAERDEAVRLLKRVVRVLEGGGGYTRERCAQIRADCDDDGGEPCVALDAVRAWLEKKK